MFEINSVTGQLRIERVLDRETDVTSYTVIVGAVDGGNPPMSSQVMVSVEVADANDQTPVFLNLPYAAIVNEVAPVISHAHTTNTHTHTSQRTLLY